jgi:deoxycytidine triphosphate deaminase
VRAVILSDRTLREQIAAGRIIIEPFDDHFIQPSSIDVRISNLFRVFRNFTAKVIDVKHDMTSLTEPVEIADDGVFMLHPGEFVLGSTLERIGVPDDLVGRVEGKALAIETEIPTPGGLRRMDELRPGDLVFSDLGNPVPVVAVTDTMTDRPCYEVTFSDGTQIIADGAHQWMTTTKLERRRGDEPQVRTTEEIADTVTRGREYNHQVHLAASAHYPHRQLPIEPYTFGVWLGDGTSTKAEVTTADAEVVDEIAKDGYAVWPATAPLAYRIGGTHRTRNGSSRRFEADASLNSVLRLMGQFGNKHVPREYLESSLHQRMALLQGLMDSDGHLDAFGRAEFGNKNEQLAESVRELVASLGMTATLNKGGSTLYGVDCGPRYRVRFTPDRPVFRLERKLTNLKLTGRTMLARSIRSVRSVPSVPVRCIQVGSSTGVFLATRSYIPTHNSSLGRLGLIIHSTAGFIDAGFDGHITLELTNIATLPITLYPGMKIGQVSFMEMTTPAENPYGSGARGSKYQGQRGPTPSRYFENFES